MTPCPVPSSTPGNRLGAVLASPPGVANATPSPRTTFVVVPRPAAPTPLKPAACSCYSAGCAGGMFGSCGGGPAAAADCAAGNAAMAASRRCSRPASDAAVPCSRHCTTSTTCIQTRSLHTLHRVAEVGGRGLMLGSRRRGGVMLRMSGSQLQRWLRMIAVPGLGRMELFTRQKTGGEPKCGRRTIPWSAPGSPTRGEWSYFRRLGGFPLLEVARGREFGPQ
jgi:hypothetical protein